MKIMVYYIGVGPWDDTDQETAAGLAEEKYTELVGLYPALKIMVLPNFESFSDRVEVIDMTPQYQYPIAGVLGPQPTYYPPVTPGYYPNPPNPNPIAAPGPYVQPPYVQPYTPNPYRPYGVAVGTPLQPVTTFTGGEAGIVKDYEGIKATGDVWVNGKVVGKQG